MTKAIGHHEYGTADVLRPIEVELPQPGPGQVRIAVRAAGVNPLDSKVRSGVLEAIYPVTFPNVPGSEAAGVVEALGEGVTGVAVGDEVFGPTAYFGGYAEHALLAADRLTRKPAGMSWEQAAALPVAAETAWRVLDLLGLAPDGELDGTGATLLVHGAAGGVGTLLLQFARSRGIRVIGTASEANHDYLRELGAIPVTYGEGLAERVRAVAPNGVDRALDAAGRGDVLPLSVELTGAAERVVTITDPHSAETHGVRFTGGGEAVDHQRTAQQAAVALFESGGLVLPLHRIYPLADAARAQRDSEAGHVRGKLVLSVG
ncbi:NADP-dependent oxidoreductase [Kitasatospora sp. NPDC054939]